MLTDRTGRVFSYLFLLILLVPGRGSAYTQDGSQQSLGVYTGSISLAGLRYEKSINPENSRSLTYMAGSINLQDVEFAQQLRYYLLDMLMRPYGGVGLCEVFASQDHAATLLVNITGALGLDWNLPGRYHLGGEFILHYMVFDFPLTGDGVRTSASFFTRQFAPWIGLYLGREF